MIESARIFPDLILPLEEQGGGLTLNSEAFVRRLVKQTLWARERAIYYGDFPFFTSYVQTSVLGNTPRSLQADVKTTLLPLLTGAMQDARPHAAFTLLYAILTNYAQELGEELGKQIKTPNFSAIPKQSGLSDTFYMGLHQNLLVTKTENYYYGASERTDDPAASWDRQIRDITGWCALRDLIRHIGAEVKVQEPDAAVYSMAINGLERSIPYPRFKYVRDRALIIDKTVYLGEFMEPIERYIRQSKPKSDGEKARQVMTAKVMWAEPKSVRRLSKIGSLFYCLP